MTVSLGEDQLASPRGLQAVDLTLVFNVDRLRLSE